MAISITTAGGEKGRKKKSTSVIDSEMIEVANLLIQLSGGSSDAIAVGKTTAHRDDCDHVYSSSLKYKVFGDDDENEVCFSGRIGKKRFRLVKDLYEQTKPLTNGGHLVLVNRKRRKMVV